MNRMGHSEKISGAGVKNLYSSLRKPRAFSKLAPESKVSL